MQSRPSRHDAECPAPLDSSPKTLGIQPGVMYFHTFHKTDSGSPGESQNYLKSFNKCFCLKKALRINSSTNKSLGLYILLFLHSRMYNSCLKMCFFIFKKCMCNKNTKKNGIGGCFPWVQWLRPHTPNAGWTSIPDQGIDPTCHT